MLPSVSGHQQLISSDVFSEQSLAHVSGSEWGLGGVELVALREGFRAGARVVIACHPHNICLEILHSPKANEYCYKKSSKKDIMYRKIADAGNIVKFHGARTLILKSPAIMITAKDTGKRVVVQGVVDEFGREPEFDLSKYNEYLIKLFEQETTSALLPNVLVINNCRKMKINDESNSE
ncbi:hypothetical protein [Endozoicomonas sp.]|uniref:hypothetical protein n=1 Tax=Endozoicomonas sp. TaxID=1892382 RepID=UPI002884E70C|nr:hypothetical protein [Endozoicomonas sp.]